MGSLHNVTLNNGQATVSAFNEAVSKKAPSGYDALTRLREASTVLFEDNISHNISDLAQELRDRAVHQIGFLDKIWDAIGSFLFSSFGFKTTEQKVKETFNEIINKSYKILGDDEKKKDESPVKDENPNSGTDNSKKDETPHKSPENSPKPEIDEQKKKAEAERAAKEAEAKKAEEARVAKEEAEQRAQETERAAKEAEAKKAEEERVAKEEAEKRAQEAERAAKEAEAKKAEEARIAKEEAEKRAQEAERAAKEAEAKKAEEARVAKEEAEKRAQEAERATKEAEAKKAEEARIAKEEAEKRAQEAERAAKEAEAKKAVEARVAKEEAEKRAQEAERAAKEVEAKKAEEARIAKRRSTDTEATARTKISKSVKEDVKSAVEYAHTLINDKARNNSYEFIIRRTFDFGLSLQLLDLITDQTLIQSLKKDMGLHSEEELKQYLDKIPSTAGEIVKAIDKLEISDHLASMMRVLNTRLARIYIDANDYGNVLNAIQNIGFVDLAASFSEIAERIPDSEKEASLNRLKPDVLQNIVSSIVNPVTKDRMIVSVIGGMNNFADARRLALTISDLKLREDTIYKNALKEHKEIDFSPDGDSDPSKLLNNKKELIKKYINENNLKEARALLETIKFEDVKQQLNNLLQAKINEDKKAFVKKIEDHLDNARLSIAIAIVNRVELIELKMAGVEAILQKSNNYEGSLKALNLISDANAKKKLADTYGIYTEAEMAKKMEEYGVSESLKDLKFEEARSFVKRELINAKQKSSFTQYITTKEIEHLVSQKMAVDAKLLDYIVYADLKEKYKNLIK